MCAREGERVEWSDCLDEGCLEDECLDEECLEEDFSDDLFGLVEDERDCVGGSIGGK